MQSVAQRTVSPHEFREVAAAMRSSIEQVIVGQHHVVNDVMVALLAGGHVLLEGVPGLGKTRLVQTVGSSLGLSFGRIQFTPDLMPADITGTNILHESEDGHRSFAFEPGPVFANVVLADEINRATPKTQSALLEAMQEGTVTAAGARHVLPRPFFVLATQNPVEMEGTYPLPEAQLDRFFFKVVVPFPSAEEMADIVRRTTGVEAPLASAVADADTFLAMTQTARDVPIAHSVLDYAVRMVMASHPTDAGAPGLVRQYVRYGASPRAAQTIVMGARVMALLDGRSNVAFEDVAAVTMPALRHRLVLNFDAEANDVNADAIVKRLLEAVPQAGF